MCRRKPVNSIRPKQGVIANTRADTRATVRLREALRFSRMRCPTAAPARQARAVDSSEQGPDTMQNFSITQFVYGVESSQVRVPLVNRRDQQNGVTLSPLESLRFSPVLPESHTLISATATQCGLAVGLCPSARVRHFCLSGKGKAPRDGQAAPRPVSAGCQT